MSDKTILVTGGTGFLGQEIVNCLVKKDYKVRVLTRSLEKYEDTKNINYVKGDILDIESIKLSLKGCYGLIHSAGEKSDVSKMHLVNVGGTKNVCIAANLSDIKYFCHVSSVGVIGLTKNKTITESSNCHPINLYEKTKLIAERYVVQHFKLKYSSRVILRPTNIFGEKDIIFLPSFSNKLKRWIKGNEALNFVYVKDVAAACVFFIDKTKTKLIKEIFIVNDLDYSKSFKSLYKLLGIASVFYPPITIPWFLRFIKSGKNNLGNKHYSAEKLKNTGFKAPFGLDGGIKDITSSI